ncbi:MAG: hypothetical protein B1H13_11320 [Desulfobacteraceae bacterium 4484_190.3]|nr:MAG: hypothetical protein B1H13_11320 [Desulfobacteraceae bacterium 4484_190.3]
MGCLLILLSIIFSFPFRSGVICHDGYHYARQEFLSTISVYHVPILSAYVKYVSLKKQVIHMSNTGAFPGKDSVRGEPVIPLTKKNA